MTDDTTCPVCGYPELTHPAYLENCPSHEICESCGFQFGKSDDDEHITFEEWRHRWVRSGMRWRSRGIKQPADWDPAEQLKRLTGP